MKSIRSMTASLAVVVALTTSVNIQAQSGPPTRHVTGGRPHLTATKQQQGEIVTVDWKSFDRLGNNTSFWLLRSFTETTLLGHDLYPHRSQRIQYVIDCTDRSYALSQWVLTDGENGAGQVVWTDRNSEFSYVKAMKGTIEAEVVDAACSTEPTTRVAEHQQRFLLDSSPLPPNREASKHAIEGFSGGG